MRRWLLAIAIFLPLCWLFHPRLQFQSWEWFNHHWLVSYQAEHWRVHGGPAEVINTNSLAGMPYPVFYGYLFYPLMGLIARFIGTDGSFRLLSLLLTALPFALSFRLLLRVAGDWWIALLTASAGIWATYTLTNLYCRAALTEFAAVAFLTCALCQLLQAGLEEHRSVRYSRLLESGLFFALAAGIHPITALFGGMFLGVIALGAVSLNGQWRSFVAMGSVVGVLGLVVLGPWLYVVMKFRGTLMVDRMNTQLSHLMFSPANDNLLLRLWPLPYTPIAQEPGITPFPYIETQVSLTLLLLVVILCFRLFRHHQVPGELAQLRRARILSLASLGLFLVLLVLSVWPLPWQFIPRFFWIIQFSYRLVSYMNLALLVGCFAAALALGGSGLGAGLSRRVWLLLLFGLAATSLVVKLAHVGAIRDATPLDVSQSALLRMPKTFYGYYAYASGVSTQRPIPAQADLRFSLPPGTNHQFGVVQPGRLSVPTPSSVCVPVQPFPWNQILLNGSPVDPTRSTAFSDGIVVEVPAGDLLVEYSWRPDPVWRWWRYLSWITLVAWTVLILVRWVRETRFVRGKVS